MSACEITTLSGHDSKVNKATKLLDFREMADATGRCFKVKQRVKTPRGTVAKVSRFRQSGIEFGADLEMSIGSNKLLKFVFLENILTI